jgi:hypothetical protein
MGWYSKMRGKLTQEINDIAKMMIGREISQVELRLIAYIQYVMMNEQRIDIAKINQEERKILSNWRKEGVIDGGASPMSITKPFWNFMCEVLFEGYVKEGGGAKRIIEKNNKIKIILEYNPYFLREAKYSPLNLLTKLDKEGFLLSIIKKDKLEKINTKDFKRVSLGKDITLFCEKK